MISPSRARISVNPACAGMIRACPGPCDVRDRKPRVCGDDPIVGPVTRAHVQ